MRDKEKLDKIRAFAMDGKKHYTEQQASSGEYIRKICNGKFDKQMASFAAASVLWSYVGEVIMDDLLKIIEGGESEHPKSHSGV